MWRSTRLLPALSGVRLQKVKRMIAQLTTITNPHLHLQALASPSGAEFEQVNKHGQQGLIQSFTHPGTYSRLLCQGMEFESDVM